jgi:hypothetical protein
MAALRSRAVARALADALCLYLIPLGVALLPWPVGFALLKRLAGWPLLYHDSIRNLWAGAAAYSPGVDPRQWQRRARLLLLVEHTDTWLIMLRGDRWWRRYMRLEGDIPPAGQANLLLTFHWGTGNWIWRVLRAHGIGAYFLARRPQGRSLGLTRLSHWYGRLRGWSLRRAGGSGVIFTGDSGDAIRQALARKASVIGMLDLGVRDRRQAVAGSLLGRAAQLPSGLARIAAEGPTAVTLFSVGLDFETGARDLSLQTLPAATDVAGIMDAYFHHLDQRLRAAPEAWQMWHEAQAIFTPAGDDAA